MFRLKKLNFFQGQVVTAGASKEMEQSEEEEEDDDISLPYPSGESSDDDI